VTAYRCHWMPRLLRRKLFVFPAAQQGSGFVQGPDLQNILRQSYDYIMIMPKLRPTDDGRLIYKTSYSEWKSFHG